MTTQYTESNRLPAYQHARDLDAREALQRIDRERNGLLSGRRFRHESLLAWRAGGARCSRQGARAIPR